MFGSFLGVFVSGVRDPVIPEGEVIWVETIIVMEVGGVVGLALDRRHALSRRFDPLEVVGCLPIKCVLVERILVGDFHRDVQLARVVAFALAAGTCSAEATAHQVSEIALVFGEDRL